nr:Ycf60 [Erythrocladia irregularis]
MFEKPKPVLSHIPGLTRLLCIVPYFLPLLESFDHFAGRIMADYPQDLVRKYKLMFRPIVEFYTQNRLVNFVSFLMLYFLLVSSKSPIRVHPFLRYNTLQALLTFLVTTILGVAFRIFPKEIKRSIYGGIISNTFFLTVAYIIVYALIQALRGKYADIPIISEAVRIQINSKGI